MSDSKHKGERSSGHGSSRDASRDKKSDRSDKFKSKRRQRSSSEYSSPECKRRLHRTKRKQSSQGEVKSGHHKGNYSSDEEYSDTRRRLPTKHKKKSYFHETDLCETVNHSKQCKVKEERIDDEIVEKSKHEQQSSKYGKVSAETRRYHDHKLENVKCEKKTDESESNSEEEIMFEWEHHRWELNQMFFGERDLIKRGSEDYKDFFKFLGKYQTLCKQKKLQKIVEKQAKKSQNDCKIENKPSTCATSAKFGLPVQFDNKHLVNFVVKGETEESLMRKLPPRDLDDKKKRLSVRRVREFRTIILLYFNFNQKKNFEKMKQLRKGQKELPIAQFREEILSTVALHSIVLIAGDTGCGKSTQVPQYLMAAGYNKIACTQPRRIACISLCKRVAHETLNEHGSHVGFQIRFERRTSEYTKILFLTEGLLLRQVQSDPSLGSYDVVILDEIHERHLHTDFLLGVVKCLLMRRTNLKIILMSATINLDLFSKYFMGEAPVIQVPGRLYPIKLQYFPVPLLEQVTKSDKLNPAPYVRVLQLIDNKYPEDERGDVLMFLSGFSEINTVVEAAKLYAQQSRRWIILSLHSNLSVSDQEKVFDVPPEGVRKCIVSTNIAETSITIDGVRFVVDSGKVKEMSYDATCKMQKLQEFWVSQASAQQRKGRAGRTGPGVCFRLYSEEQYDAFDPYSTPEIQRVPLDSLVLQMIAMGLPDIRLFPFIEPPSLDSLEISLKSLKSLAAVTGTEELTSTGRLLAQLPVDVTVGKILLMGSLFHQVGCGVTLPGGLWGSSSSGCTGAVQSARRPLHSPQRVQVGVWGLQYRWGSGVYSTGGLRSTVQVGFWGLQGGFWDLQVGFWGLQVGFWGLQGGVLGSTVQVGFWNLQVGFWGLYLKLWGVDTVVRSTCRVREKDCLLCSYLFGGALAFLPFLRGWLEEKCGRGGGSGSSSSRRWCRTRGLEEQRLYELTKLRHQFSHLMQESKLRQSSRLESGACSTTAERAQRHGELQQLKALKKSVDQQSSRKVKVLKVDRDGAPMSDEETESMVDRKHLDFAMKNDPKQLRQLLDHADVHSFKDIIMLKIILSSGLYPNVALADEHNNYKPNSEQLFHTPSKPFAALHPTSVFSKHPEVLQVSDADVLELPTFSTRCPPATRQQILVYVSLLETNKAFLMNSFRAPTAQTLLLFANKIDSNADFSTLVFDSFIELRFPEAHVAQDLVVQAVQLRTQWDQLLELKLRLSEAEACELEILTTAGKLERVLSHGLVEFYMEEPLHSQRRLLAADVKVLHKGPGLEDAVLDPNPFTGQPLAPNPQDGGLVVTPYLSYNSIMVTECTVTTLTQTETPCVQCGEVLLCTPLHRMHHVLHCRQQNNKKTSKEEGHNDTDNPNAKKFHCHVCNETFWLSIKEIFAHKKAHSS
ncbi:Helicase-associated domain [Trinorchestia longiramus]|nr:Helicase-associated domain [Trinorchestia longiramus]